MMLFSCRTFEAVGHLRPARPLLLLIEVHSPLEALRRECECQTLLRPYFRFGLLKPIPLHDPTGTGTYCTSTRLT